jgi:nitrate/nitrite-specific signal transduction histidine kinase
MYIEYIVPALILIVFIVHILTESKNGSYYLEKIDNFFRNIKKLRDFLDQFSENQFNNKVLRLLAFIAAGLMTTLAVTIIFVIALFVVYAKFFKFANPRIH